MSGSINSTVIGTVGGDPELREHEGTKYTEVGIAVSRGRDTPTTWVRAKFAGKMAETVAQYVHKGDKFSASGTMELREFTSKAGKSGAALELRANGMTLIGKTTGPNNDGGTDFP